MNSSARPSCGRISSRSTAAIACAARSGDAAPDRTAQDCAMQSIRHSSLWLPSRAAFRRRSSRAGTSRRPSPRRSSAACSARRVRAPGFRAQAFAARLGERGEARQAPHTGTSRARRFRRRRLRRRGSCRRSSRRCRSAAGRGRRAQGCVQRARAMFEQARGLVARLTARRSCHARAGSSCRPSRKAMLSSSTAASPVAST